MSQQDSALERGSVGVEADTVARTAEAADRSEGGDFAVRFEANGLGRPKINLGLSGRGHVVIRGDGVDLLGKPRGLFGWAASRQHQIGREQIINVRHDGLVIGFMIRDANGRCEPVAFKATDDVQARCIVAALPDAQTPEFSRARAEASDFLSRLDQVSGKPVVTPVIVAINVAVFVAMCIAGVGIFQVDGAAVIGWGSNYGALTMDGQWWRLLTSNFVHFGLIHIGLNMLVLWRNGPLVERLFGRLRFALLYLVAGLAGSVASLLWHPDVNSAGASGAIFGVFGAFLAFVINKRNGVPPTVMQAHLKDILGFTAINLVYGFGHTGIDNAAHLGGLAGGFAMGFLLARPLDKNVRMHGQPGRALALAAAGLAALAVVALPILHPSPSAMAHRQFRAALFKLSDQEQAAIDAYKPILAQASTISVTAFALRVNSEVLPKWDIPYRTLAGIHLAPDDSDFALHQATLRYFRDRRERIVLLTQAGRISDDELKSKLDAADNDAKAADEQILTLMAAGR